MQYKKLVFEFGQANSSEMSTPDSVCCAYIELKAWWNI